MRKLKIILQSKYLLLIVVLITAIYGFIVINNDKVVTNDGIDLYGYVTKIIKKDNYFSYEVSNRERYIVNLYKEISDIELGDYILFYGTYKIPHDNTNFNLFNYRLYLKSNKINYIFTSNDYKIINKNKSLLYNIKSIIIDRIKDYESSDYLNAFVIGDKSYIDSDIKNDYQSIGVSHLLAISGMHISFLTSIILFVLNIIKKSNSNYIIVILLLFLYLFIVGNSPSVVRTFYLFLFLYLNRLFKLNIKNYYILIYILCFMIVYNPFYIYNVGFQFSYTISLSLLYFSSLITRQKGYIRKLFMLSFISYISSIPIMITNFFYINIFSILFNMLFVPYVSYVVFPLSFITILFKPLDKIYLVLIRIMEYLANIFNSINMCVVLRYINYLVLFYIVIIFFLLYYLKNRNKRYYICLVILLLTILIHSNINNLIDDKSIHFIDVGQGDSILLIIDDKSILIDTGGSYYGSNIARNTLIPYLRSNGISSLDYLIITHGDIDHIGESINLINGFKIYNVLLNSGNSNTYEDNLINLLNVKNINYKNISRYKLRVNDVLLNFVNDKDLFNENEDSLVIYTVINNKKILLTGDIGKSSEEYLLDEYNIRNIDILKVAHHGSKYSSSKRFLDSIRPKYAVIEVGLNNKFNHPNIETINNLNNNGVKYYLTSKNGGIKVDLNRYIFYTNS